ncbi:MAG: branched-chain amino acid aminotransferase [Alphaproteobacteria bacterium]|nr:branched-chain amino acid aminotransferase [Alphaproteobacteria bacterium]
MAKVHSGGRIVSYVNEEWHDGNVPVMGTLDDGAWLGQSVFDGARYFDGAAPDLDRHCERVIRSAKLLAMSPGLTATDIEALAKEGIKKFPPDVALYICAYFYLGESFFGDTGDSTRFSMAICEAPMPDPVGFSACMTRFRRPSKDMAPTEAKAACLYPNVRRSVAAAKERGYDQAVVLDPNGNIAEFSFTNLFMAKDGVVSTPAINGTFLNGITRQRVIKLLRDDGFDVLERAIDFSELLDADEAFSTANYSKVLPCTRIEDRDFNAGPVYTRARELYFEWAKTQTV